ncbi:MAG: DUF4007 family protein [Pseudanabaena sp.]
MAELNLSFHATFALKKADVLRIIKAAEEEKGLDDSRDNLVARTGMGAPKVGALKTWATRSGLVDNVKLTPQGAIARKHDPYLQSPITDWLMHFYLSFSDKGLATPPPDPAEWGGWTWFVYSFLPQRKTFTRQELESYAGSVFTKAAKNIAKDLNILLRAYTEPHALFGCGFVNATEKDKFAVGQANQPNDYLIAYLLSQLWERDFGDTNSIQTREILQQKLGLKEILGINADSLQTILDRLEAKAIIEQNRAVSPAETVRRWHNPLDLLEKAYAE